MKRNRIFRDFGQAVIDHTAVEDASELKVVRQMLGSISTYTKGVVRKIGDDFRVGEDKFDYDAFDMNFVRYFAEIRDYAEGQYLQISKRAGAVTKRIFLTYRELLEKALDESEIGFDRTKLEEANITFGGSPSQAFNRHLKAQLQTGTSPANLIVTVSQDHVKLIQRELLSGVSRGKGFDWGVTRVLREMYPAGADELILKRAEYNVTRIMRTSFMTAVNADASELAAASPTVFYGLRRTADGRPCLACIAQDGRFYKPGEPMVDHPNGMCMLVPLMYPDEYFLTGTIRKPAGDLFDRPMLQKFYQMSEAEQRKAFGNDKLFALWKKEKFDIAKLVAGDFEGQVSYRSAMANLDKLGGISHPKIKFANDPIKSDLLGVMDPKDRDSKSLIAVREKPPSVKWHKVDLTGDGTEFLLSDTVSNDTKARIMALFGEGADLPWYQFNERARLLGLYTRKDINGNLYYVMKPSEFKAAYSPKVSKVTAKAAKTEFLAAESEQSFTVDEFVAHAKKVNLQTGEGLENLRWSKEGQARAFIDKADIDGQTVSIFRFWDPKTSSYGYRFDLKVTSGRGSIIKDRYVTKAPHTDLNRVEGKMIGLKDGQKIRGEIEFAEQVKPFGYSEGGGTWYCPDYMGRKDNPLHNAYSNRIIFDSTPGLDLEDSLAAFRKNLDEVWGLEGTLSPIEKESFEKYLAERIKWADREYAVGFDISKVRVELVDGYPAIYYEGGLDLSGTDYLYHSGRTPYFSEVFDSGKLLSSDIRLQTGVSGGLNSGMSTAQDLLTGGSNGVFTRTATKEMAPDALGTSRFQLVIDKKELTRIDWYGFHTDTYGDINQIRDLTTARKDYLSWANSKDAKWSQRNEQIFRNTISLSKVRCIVAGDERTYSQILTYFRDKGLKKVNGVPLEQFVLKVDSWGKAVIDPKLLA